MARRKMFYWKKCVSVLAGVVVFVTVYALILPALTMTKTEQVLNCPVDIHEHSEDCYDEEGCLICGKENYVVHIHEAGCFDEAGMLICNLSQIPEHTHSNECYNESQMLICENNAEHTHTEQCFESVLSCEMEEHSHTEDCLDEDGYLVCEKEEHEHSEGCAHELVLTCEMKEHVHSEECYELVRELVCGRQEIKLHLHSEECYDTDGNLVCGAMEVRAHQHGDGCFETVKIAEDPKGEVLETTEEGTVEVKITEVPSEEMTNGTDSKFNETVAAETVEETVLENADASLNEEALGSEEETGQVEETSKPEVSEEASITKQRLVTRTYTGRDFAITVQTGEDANIPINSTLCVNEVMPGTEEYAHYYSLASESVYGDVDQQVVFARFFDICFMADGQEVEPQAPVDVIIAYQNRVEFPEGDQGVVHFDNDGMIQNVSMGNVADSAAEEAFALSCYSEENAFTFEADSFSVWGTTIVRTYESGSTTASCALRKVTSSLSGGTILYTTSITPDHTDVVYEISTRSNAEPGKAIPIVGAYGIDGISLSSPELKVTKNGTEINAADINGKLYCQANDSFVRVAYLSVDQKVLIPLDENGNRLNGTLYLAHDEMQHTIDWGVKNLSVVIDTEELAKGKSPEESIIWFDVIGTKGEDGYIQDAYTISFKGTEGDVFRLSDYFAGEEFYYGKWTEHVDQNNTEYTENPRYNDDRTFSHGLEIASFIKIVNYNGNYEMRPCDQDGNLLWNDLGTRITLYSVTDTLYQFAFTVNTMVKEHGEDDGKAYFWNGTDFILGSSSDGTVRSLDVTTFRYNSKSYDFSDYSRASTAIQQVTYYLTGRIGESLIASEASDTKIRPGDDPTNPMTAILYAASGSQTTAVNATSWDTAWRGAYDVANLGKESYLGWHTTWIDMGAHNSDQGGWRRYHYFVRDYLVLDSSWDKAMNFIVGEGENGIPVLSIQKYDDAMLYPLIDPYTSVHRPSSGWRQNSGNTLYGYNQNGSGGKQALQLIYARPGIIARKIYQAADGTAPEMNHIQLRVDSNVVIEMDGIKYQGSFLYMSGKVSPYAYVDGRWESMLNGDNSYVTDLSQRKWSTLKIANSQESGRVEIDPKYTRDSRGGYSRLWDTPRLNIAIEYHLAGVLKPLMTDGKPDSDKSHWILYADTIPKESNYMSDNTVDPIAKAVIETINEALKGNALRSGEFVYSVILDHDQLQQATYACPNTEGYDVILDVNAAFSKSFELQEKIIMAKYWDDLGYEMFRPDSVTAVLQRAPHGTDQWSDLQEVAFTGVKNEMQWVASYTLKADESTGSWDYRVKPGSERYIWNETHANDLHLRYEASYDGLNLTNKVVMPKVNVAGYKIWNNSDGSVMKKEEIPESITLNLYQSKVARELGVLYDSRVVTEGTDHMWAWSFDQMDKYFIGENGKLQEYTYTVAEVKATDWDGYEVLHEYSGSVLGGQFVDGELELIDKDQIVEGEGNSFIFINQRKPVISFRKVDPNGSALAEAEFVLTSSSGNVSVTFVSDSDGYLIRRDKDEPTRSVELDRDTDYLLTEIKAPVGYTKLTEPIHIRYDTRTQRWMCTYKNETLTLRKIDAEHGDFVMLDIENQGVRLPETGGSGTRQMTIVGIILVAFSLLLLGWLSGKKKRCD